MTSPAADRPGAERADRPAVAGADRASAPSIENLSIAELPLSRTRPLGRFRLHALEAGLQRLDGGAMFGVVPKSLWQKRIPADARNRIPLAMRCLLIETPDALVLVDDGAGNKEDAKFRDIYALENAGEPTRLEDAVRDAGFTPEDVTVVVNTHLHFDHAGGNTYVDDEARLQLAFPRARYHVQKGEFEYAHWQNERIQASYLPRNFDPVEQAGRFVFHEGETEILPGIRLLPTPGHTPYHQSVLVESEGISALFLGDLVPTSAHLAFPWIMGYDVEPLVTLDTKKKLIGAAREQEWLLIFEHDPVVPWGTLDPDKSRPKLRPE